MKCEAQTLVQFNYEEKPRKCSRFYSPLNERLSITSLFFFVSNPCLSLDANTDAAQMSLVEKTLQAGNLTFDITLDFFFSKNNLYDIFFVRLTQLSKVLYIMRLYSIFILKINVKNKK